jgi:phenylpropionate dioxygenase-like ring-hydroxylating dioxygenase large terminal subunit
MAMDVHDLYDADTAVLSPRVFVDDQVFDLEMERLFTRCWLFLCPEQQIPNPGDFFVTQMGSDRVIVVRQRDGSIKALLNQCRHRSSELTLESCGNTRTFTCPYHGWTYDLAGNLRRMPHEGEGIVDHIDKSQWGCIEVPRLSSYRGLLFGCWDPEAPTLEEYLGDAAWYLDIWCDRFEGGMELVGGVIKFVGASNWKLGAEQFAWDDLHAESTHPASLMASMPADFDITSFDFAALEGWCFTDENGHGSIINSSDSLDVPLLSLLVGPDAAGYWRDTRPEVAQRLGTARGRVLAGHMTVFPNMSVVGGMNSIRMWQPISPNETEMWFWVFVPADAPEKVKRSWYRGTASSFGAGGVIESDDGAAWSSIQRTLRGAMARRTPLNMQMAMGHMKNGNPDYPGLVSKNRFCEGPARSFYERWVELLTLDDWAQINASAAKRAGAQR